MENKIDLLTIEQLADYLQVPRKTIYYWVSRKQIPYLKFGRHLRFNPLAVVESFVEQLAARTPACLQDNPGLKSPFDNRKASFRRSLTIRNRSTAETERK